METKIVSTKAGKLVIVRHHESEWNKLGKWTGLYDAHLTPYGFEESEKMGELLHDICFDYAFASMQVRSIETLSSILSICKADPKLPTEHAAALDERDYGDYTGKNKWDIEKMIGEEEFNKLRRSWDYPIPHGETLKMVSERAVPFFLEKIVPLVTAGKNVLVVSHGNTIRTLIKFIEHVSDVDIAHIEMPFGGVLIYELDTKGHILHKEIRMVESKVNA
jgi:2,3-bisphosphoglycerate-dependent phosphoglycerate mutase